MSIPLGETQNTFSYMVDTAEIKIQDLEDLRNEAYTTLHMGVKYIPNDELKMAQSRIEQLEHRLIMVNAQLNKWIGDD